MMCSAHKILFECWNQEESDGRGMWQVWDILPAYQTRLHAHNCAIDRHSHLLLIGSINIKWRGKKTEAGCYALR